MAVASLPRLSQDAEQLHTLLGEIGGSVSLRELSYQLDATGFEVMELLVELEEAGMARATYFEAVRP